MLGRTVSRNVRARLVAVIVILMCVGIILLLIRGLTFMVSGCCRRATAPALALTSKIEAPTPPFGVRQPAVVRACGTGGSTMASLPWTAPMPSVLSASLSAVSGICSPFVFFALKRLKHVILFYLFLGIYCEEK